MASNILRRVKGASYHAKQYPDLYERVSRNIMVGYAYPRWWAAWKMNPPKVMATGNRLKKLELPTDKLVDKLQKRMPMLKLEPYEHSLTFIPLSVRFAQTQLRLMETEGYTEEAAYKKCEDEIFKTDLEEFANTMKSHMQMIPETPSRASRLAQIHMFINNKIADGQNFEESLKEFEAEQKQTLMEHSEGAPVSTVEARRALEQVQKHYKYLQNGVEKSALVAELASFVDNSKSTLKPVRVASERVDGVDFDVVLAKHKIQQKRKPTLKDRPPVVTNLSSYLSLRTDDVTEVAVPLTAPEGESWTSILEKEENQEMLKGAKGFALTDEMVQSIAHADQWLIHHVQNRIREDDPGSGYDVAVTMRKVAYRNKFLEKDIEKVLAAKTYPFQSHAHPQDEC